MTRADWRLRAGTLGLLACAAVPLVGLLLAHRLWVRRKGMHGLAEKLTGRGGAVPPGGILVHGVSLGEVNLMRPLVPALESALGARCVLSTSTETGWQRLGEVFADRPRVLWPLDLPWAVERFLARTRPRAIVLLELEVWPLLLAAAARRGIPVLLLNARVSERSHRGYRRAGAWLRPSFRAMSLAVGQNGPWTARLRDLGCRTAVVGGSMKADMVRPASPAQAQALAARLGLDPAKPLLLLASTSPDEEAALLGDRLAWWRNQGWQVVICPRHPERGGELAELAQRLGGTPWRSSQVSAPPTSHLPPPTCWIVDEIGQLAALYALCAGADGIAVVGGSQGSGRGGQNMLEPAAAGACTVVGWDTRNFPDAMALLRAADGVVELAQGADLPAALAALAADPERRRRIGAGGRQAWEAGRGATARQVTLARQALYPAAPPTSHLPPSTRP